MLNDEMMVLQDWLGVYDQFENDVQIQNDVRRVKATTT